MLGSNMTFNISNLLILAVVLSLFVLFIKPIIIMALIGFIGYKKRTSFLAGTSLAQISEFSLILVTLALSLGHLSSEIVSMLTVVGIITITGSTYLMHKGNSLYNFLSKYLTIFERKNTKMEEISLHNKSKKYQVILFGYNRTGYSLVKKLQKMKKSLLIVDFNPDVIQNLAKENIPCKYGDASDTEMLKELNIEKVKMVISTIIDTEVNLQLVNKIKEINKKAIVIFKANQIDEALQLYDAGANYVILPHFLGGEHASLMIEKYKGSIGKFLKVKLSHVKELKKRKQFGHEPPSHERH
jgi:FlaA1/EpsC-like NDP-sugar epimerase